jgi:hypothetical protein
VLGFDSVNFIPPSNALQRTRVRPAGGRSPLSCEMFGRSFEMLKTTRRMR